MTGFTISALAVYDGGEGPELCAAGSSITQAGGVAAFNAARWDGTRWASLGQGLNDDVHAVAVFDDGGGPDLYAGGSFTEVAGVPASRIVRWDGSGWSVVAAGANDEVHALEVWDDGNGPALYAGGRFSHAGGVLTVAIARWDGASWSALGSGMTLFAEPPSVLALTVHDDGSGERLYAGGHFETAGGVAADNVACWDGASWSALGSGTIGVVRALGEHDDGSGPALFVGGDFTTAGAVPANYVARWDGTSWSALGGGMTWPGETPEVHAFATFDAGSGPRLYAGGYFTFAGGVPANMVATWDGTSWSGLGGLDDRVRAFAVYDDGSGPTLYAGGDFSMTIGAVVGSIARLDGTSWSPLGGGANAGIADLVVYDDGSGPVLVGGGDFTSARDSGDSYLAAWGGCAPFAFPPFCDASDGSLASCPCANPGDADSGCDLPQGTGGVRLDVVAQQTAPNAVTMQGVGFNATGFPPAVVIRSSSLDPASPVVFGDGLRCVNTSPLVRLGGSQAINGVSTHAFGHGAMAGAGTFYYQLWFRSQPSTYCDPTALFNLSSGREVSW